VVTRRGRKTNVCPRRLIGAPGGGSVTPSSEWNLTCLLEACVHISAIVKNARDSHEVRVAAGETIRSLNIARRVAEIHDMVRSGAAVRLEPVARD